MSNKLYFPLLAFALLSTQLPAQTVQLDGHVQDAATREPLAGAVVFVREAKRNIIANDRGFYSVALPVGVYTLSASYVGYAAREEQVDLRKAQRKDFALRQQDVEIAAVTVSAERRANVEKTEMSVEKLDIKTIKRIPALMGEVDVVKAIMLLPGVQPAAEGTSAFSVRGGSPDQNLILFDKAIVYNASHLMGFFSVFNNDVVNDVKLYKGDIPTAYGGRLSSLLDVTAKNGDMHKLNVNGGIGLISSRLEVDGPIVDNKLSFLVAGRRTYADLFLPLAPDEFKEIQDAVLHFYDLNGKLLYCPTTNDRISLSGYYGTDAFGMSVAGMEFSNATYTLEWNHLYSDRFFSSLSVIGSSYGYEMNMGLAGFEAQWKSSISDIGGRADFTYLYGSEGSLHFGASSIRHAVAPGDAAASGPTGLIERHLSTSQALESALYAMNQHKLGDRLTVKYGLRATLFQNVGPALVKRYDQSYELTDSARYAAGEFFNHYWGVEPRAGLVFLLGDNSSLKASYSRTMQYMHLISNSTAGSPIDVWMPSSPSIKPQSAHQGSLGYFRNFLGDDVEASAEVFYKYMNDVVDYKD
ncbi:MAG: TonB-dependent receptor, partial [Prevotellaceae bacterium]|nr:TonB-dependent receptor [Prevotellaceae bacterium]